jgi:hypothetical protein
MIRKIVATAIVRFIRPAARGPIVLATMSDTTKALIRGSAVEPNVQKYPEARELLPAPGSSLGFRLSF